MPINQPSIQNFTNFPVEYIDANNRLQKKPVYYCTFGKVVGPLGEGSADIPDQYATGPIHNATVTRKYFMSTPSSVSSQITVAEGKSSIGSLDFTLFDFEDEITRLIASHTMKNRLVTVYGGFQDIDEEFFVSLFVGQIDDVAMTSDGTGYNFTIVNTLKQGKAPILQGVTKLKTAIGSSPAMIDIEVSSVNGFAPKTDLGDGRGKRNYIRLQDEIISYDSISIAEKKFINCTRHETPNGSGGPAVEHEEGEDVANYVLYDGNPVTLALQIMLSTGSSCVTDGTVVWKWTGTSMSADTWLENHGYSVTNSVINNGNTYECIVGGTSGDLDSGGPDRPANKNETGTNYDVFPASQGIGIPHTLVNISHMEAQRDKYTSWMTFSNYFQEKVEAQTFLEDEIFKIVNAYPIVNKSGQYDLKLWAVPLPTAIGVTLDDTNIIGIPTYQGNFKTGSNFFNQIQVNYDYHPVADYFAQVNITNNATSQFKYKEVSPFLYEAKFIKSGQEGLKIVNRITNNFLARFKDPPPIFQVQTFYTNHLLQAGDICYLNSSIVPNSATGRRGGPPQICEVIDASVDFGSGTVSLTLMATGFAFNRTFGGISPANYPVFTAATTDQRKYAFLSDLALEFTDGLMSDGSQGYYITPT